MIIDIHTHIARHKGTVSEFMSYQDILEGMLLEMKKNKVDFALVIAYFKSSLELPMTEETLELVKKIKNIKVIDTIDINYSQKDLAELDSRLKAQAVVGVKLWTGYQYFYPNDPRSKPIYELCLKYNVPVMFHSGDTYRADAKIKYSHPIHIDEVAVDYPDLKIIIAHMGNPWILDCAEVIYKNKNVYADISGLVQFKNINSPDGDLARRRIQDLIAYSSPRKLLYGTDWALTPMKDYLKFVYSLKISKEDLEYVMWKNATELFNLPTLSN